MIEAAEAAAALAAEYAAAHPDRCPCAFCRDMLDDERRLVPNSVRTLAHVNELVSGDLRTLTSIPSTRPLGITLD